MTDTGWLAGWMWRGAALNLVALAKNVEQETFHRHCSSCNLHCVIIFMQLIYAENNVVDTRQFDL